MSDFLDDMGNERTSADDRLDQLLASADTELLTAISTAQASSSRLASIRVVTLSDEFGMFHSSALGHGQVANAETNEAVLVADAALQSLSDDLDSLDHGGHRMVIHFMGTTKMTRWLLVQRELTTLAANHYLFNGERTLAAMRQENVITTREFLRWMKRLREAHQSLLYLVDHSDEGCYTPSPI
ncbi:hypothetical protein [Streptomyces caniscabiei]|uniref:hypothetical protein n=1 Tax=Streptomyces caniscabiei TaxID=2746961 RepID=UPI000A37CFD5|nr:hypothetical protein [Streptomyces caniscabiei]